MPIPFYSTLFGRKFSQFLEQCTNSLWQRDLLKLARTEARKAGIVRLDKIIVRIGNLSGVSEDLWISRSGSFARRTTSQK